MRLFAAVDPDPVARAAAARAARALAGRLAGDAPAGRPESDGPAGRLESDRPGRIRWIAPERLHVTLRFLGEVAEADAEAVRGVLRTPFETGAFTARVSGLERFPASGAPRVVWLGIDEGRDGFAAVRTEPRPPAGVGGVAAGDPAVPGASHARTDATVAGAEPARHGAGLVGPSARDAAVAG